MRVVNLVEKKVQAIAPKPVVVAAGVAKDVLDDISGDDYAGQEFCGRYIFNDTGTVLYYAFATDANNIKNYHGKLQDQQQLDCSNHGSRVSVYSVAGGNVIPTLLARIDLTTHQTIFPAIRTS